MWTPAPNDAGFQDFLPHALADGRFRPAPEPVLAGDQLQDLPSALDVLRAGVSAAKIVVTLH